MEPASARRSAWEPGARGLQAALLISRSLPQTTSSASGEAQAVSAKAPPAGAPPSTITVSDRLDRRW